MSNVIEEMEKAHPETFSEFKRIQQAQYELFCKKMYDYGEHNITLGLDLTIPENTNLSISAIIIRVNDKVQRLFNLVLRKKTNPQNESVEDAFKDTSIYCIIAQIVCNKKWGK